MATDNAAAGENPFQTPAALMAVPRVNDLLLSHEGERLVAAVSQIDGDGAKYVTSLWELDPAGGGPARRLTRSGEGEAAAAFLPGGSLLFVSGRPSPEGGGKDSSDKDHPALWLLPVNAGDPWVVAAPPGGVTAVVTARESETIVVAAKSAPGPVSAEADREWWESRRKQKISGVLYESLPVRHWDRWIGPEEIHLYATKVDQSAPGDPAELRDLTPDAGQALFEPHPVLSPDGSTLLVDWRVPMGVGRTRIDVVAIDVSSGDRRTVASAEDGSYDFEQPVFSPDGQFAVMLRTSRATVTEPNVTDLWLLDLESGAGRALNPGDEAAVHAASFNADGSALFVVTDWKGRGPLFEVDVESGKAAPLTDDDSWAAPQIAPDGASLYGLRATVAGPPRPVRLSLGGGAGEELVVLDAPGSISGPPGRLEEVTAEAADGTPLRAWLALPEGASAENPAPFVLFVHGGPVSSWNTWHWRWNPWLLAARGWAVLMPDPALSSGYGVDMIRRGWGQWGGAPFDDLMAITDAALERDDLDSSRTAAMGGSYGGYMANWIAGHTDRFKAIVSHASLWSIEQFQGTTDWPEYWASEWGYPDTNPDLYRDWSPDRSADAIRTPMLVIHGDRDYRCPIGESLRLWSDLVRRAVDARFLFFANENHWILQPGDAAVWYETVLAFLDEHVLGQPWKRPELI